MIDCLHSPYTLLLVLLLSVYVKYVKYRSLAHPVFGKADAKVLFFHQSTKFNSGFFQKNFIFNFYFDKRQAVELILPLTVDDFSQKNGHLHNSVSFLALYVPQISQIFYLNKNLKNLLREIDTLGRVFNVIISNLTCKQASR